MELARSCRAYAELLRRDAGARARPDGGGRGQASSPARGRHLREDAGRRSPALGGRGHVVMSTVVAAVVRASATVSLRTSGFGCVCGQDRDAVGIDDVFEELETLLKNPDVGAELADRGVNVCLAMTLADGLRAYLHGDKEKALLELGTATDEIAARMTRSAGASAVVKLPHPEPLSGASYSAVELMPGDREVVLLDQRALPLDERYCALDARRRGRRGDRDARRARRARDRDRGGVRRRPRAPARRGAGRSRGDGARQTAPAHAAHGGEPRVGARPDGARGREVRGPPASASRGSRRRRARSTARTSRRAGRWAASARARVPDGATCPHALQRGRARDGRIRDRARRRARRARAGKKRARRRVRDAAGAPGARLTAWELARDGFDVTLVTDSMVAQLLRRGGVDLVVVGADRIARSGDVANKIGTYGVACLAARCTACRSTSPPPGARSTSRAPTATPSPSSSEASARCSRFGGRRASAPEGVRADNPAFDVTPARLDPRDLHRARRGEPPVASATLAALACSDRACVDVHGVLAQPVRTQAAVAQGPRARGRAVHRARRRRSAASTCTPSARRRAARTSASAGARARRP